MEGSGLVPRFMWSKKPRPITWRGRGEEEGPEGRKRLLDQRQPSQVTVVAIRKCTGRETGEQELLDCF
jgi:hypothetical protein